MANTNVNTFWFDETKKRDCIIILMDFHFLPVVFLLLVGHTLLPADASGKQTGLIQQLLIIQTDCESLHVRVLLLQEGNAEQLSDTPQIPPPVLTE